MKKPFSYIGSVNSSAKIEKGAKIGLDTFIVYLAPANLSGYETCPERTIGCTNSCLNKSGRVIMDTANVIETARINKTRFFYENRPEFMRLLVREIANAERKAIAKGNKFAVRLNGTSDISPLVWKHEGKTLFEIFPGVTFYDYTKVLNRSRIVQQFANYDLTFSYSGENWDKCELALNMGLRVAVVFNVKKGQPLPAFYKGFAIVDGDITDYRPADPSGVIVGLRFKRIKGGKAANQAAIDSNFVISDF